MNTTTPRSRRRPPRFGPFIATGAIIGFAVGSAAAIFRPDTGTGGYSLTTAIGFVGLFGACVGGFAAAIVAVLLDRR